MTPSGIRNLLPTTFLLLLLLLWFWIDNLVDSIDLSGTTPPSSMSSNHVDIVMVGPLFNNVALKSSPSSSNKKPFVASLEESNLDEWWQHEVNDSNDFSKQSTILESSLVQRSHRSLDHNYYNHQNQHHPRNQETDSRKTLLMHHNENSNIHGSFMNNWPNTMKNITVTLGRDATFECVFPKLNDFRLVWFHQDHHALLAMHDTVISKNGRISVRSHANTTFYLTIHEVQENDRGFYMCQVNTKPMRIQIGYLEVNVPPSFIEEKTSSDIDIIENSSVSLHCLAKGRPEPEIIWRREDGHPIIIDIKANDSFPMIKGQHLNLVNVTRHQMGAYLCIASNGITPTISKRIFLGVSFAPVIWTHKKMIETPILSSITLECHIESYPRSNVYWQKNNQLPPIIYSDRKYTIFMNDSNVSYRFIARLKISDIQKSDFDKYTCVAKNKIGSEKTFVYLLEKEKAKQFHHQQQTNFIKPNYYESNNKNKKKLYHHPNILTTRIPNTKRAGDESGEYINKDSRDKININYDETTEQDMWEYETNYLTPELSPEMKNEASSNLQYYYYYSTTTKTLILNDTCFILILDILLTIFIVIL